MALPLNIDVTWLNTGASYNAGELRRADTTAFGGAGLALGVHGGVVRHGDTSLAVTVDGADVVTIQPGAGVVPGNAVTGTGCYRGALSTATTGNLSARNATNPRIDLVVFRAMDTDVVPAHAAYTGRFEIIAGTPAGSPGVPTLPSMAVELARITVPQTGGGTATVDSTFRTYAFAVGGEMIVPTSARLPAAAAKFQRARSLATGVRYEWNGTAWVAVPRVQGGTISAAFTVSGGAGITTVTFPEPFATIPAVTLTAEDGSPSGDFLGASSRTTTGFVLSATGPGGGTGIVSWVAVGT